MKDQWSAGISMGKDYGNPEAVGAALARLERVAARRNRSLIKHFVTATPKKSAPGRQNPSTPFTSSLISRIDLDASGPLRSYSSGSPPPRNYGQQETPTRVRVGHPMASF
jgi:hypothetical protein